MANAPKTRPPNQRPGRHSSPRGPRPVPTNRDLRAQLAAAATRLREIDSPNLADAVDEVLTPRGWATLRATDPSRTVNLQIYLTATDRERITNGAQSEHTTVTDAINAGFRKVIAGEYTPQQPTTARKGTAKDKVNLNVTPSLTLREQVEAKTGMLAVHVAADYLMYRFQAGPYADDYEGPHLAPGTVRNPKVPPAIRSLIRERSAAAGRRVTDDVNEGYQKFLAGEFVPAHFDWGKSAWADETDLVNLRITPDDDLHAQARELAGRNVLLKVAVAYLLDKYNIDPATVR